jgi:hypothetical protein
MHTRRTRLILTLACLLLLAPGCRSMQWVSVRSTPHNALVERLKLTGRGGGKPSERTVQVLRRYALEDQLGGSQQRLLARLQAIINQESSPEKLYAFAELSYLEGKRCELAQPKEALDLFEASVANAYMCLFDTRWGHRLNPYDPLFRGACDVYNGALEAALRLVGKKESLVPGSTHTIQSARQTWEVTVVARNVRWHAEDFERFEFVSDFQVAGLMNQHQSFGLGVPLIAVRKSHPEQDPSERYYPPGLSFPVTAFLRVMPECCEPPKDGHPRRALLELYDPLETTEIVVDRRRVPLESDLTTPLAYFLDKQPETGKLATLGLLRPDKYQQLAGLYMTQPYEPDKIPVLFVHGLWSDPTTWTDMFNDLRANVDVRQNYQFWFYLYPTGQPFWTSAAQMREDLARVRMELDPQRRFAALDQMVLVGHSMGGLVSKLQTVDSGEDYWSAVSNQPFQLVKASPQTRETLQRTFFFGPHPGIRRVVTIGTPHRGSDFANKYTRFLGRSLIFLPEMLVKATKELYQDNPDLFRDPSFARNKTSIDSLAPQSPLLPVLLTGRPAPWVTYHNIVGVVGYNESPEAAAEGSDGVVAFASAHLDTVASELIVDADHLNVHRHPLAVLEVRRILLEHLASQHRWQGPQTPEFRTTGHEAMPNADFGLRNADWITPLPAGPWTVQPMPTWTTAP